MVISRGCLCSSHSWLDEHDDEEDNGMAVIIGFSFTLCLKRIQRFGLDVFVLCPLLFRYYD
jgi:hypothetical protein